jgi:hypothetical protein
MGNKVILVRQIGVLISVLIVVTTIILTAVDCCKYATNNSTMHNNYLLAVLILSIISLIIFSISFIIWLYYGKSNIHLGIFLACGIVFCMFCLFMNYAIYKEN